MRVAYLSEGASPHDRRFLRLFAQAGHAVGWSTLFGEPAARHVEDLPGVAALGGAQDLPGFAPDVVVAGPLHTAAFAAALLGLKPLVAVSWGSDALLHAVNDPSAALAAAFALRHAAAALADARAVADRLDRLATPDGRLQEVVPWGVDLDPQPDAILLGQALRARLGLSPRDALVFSNRTLSPLYRPLTAVRAFARALARRPELFLYLAGSGEMAAQVAQEASRLGIAGRVCLAGRLDATGMAAGYAAADIYLSCSSSDGSSISLLEAMAARLPVVVTDIPGNREWVSPGRNGFLGGVDDVSALANGLAELAGMTRDRRRDMGLQSRRLAEARADWAVNGARILRLAEQAAHSQQRRIP